MVDVFILVIFIPCVDFKFESAFKIDEARDVSSSKASSHKYLQVGLLADENVAAKHGNNTADFLLILANIVRNSLKINLMRMELACLLRITVRAKLRKFISAKNYVLTCDTELQLVFASVNHFKIEQLVA